MIIRCITWKTYIYYTAYAGKTCDIWQGRGSLQDHPRIRGKDTYPPRSLMHLSGSPPHTRERPLQLLLADEDIRITPAYAGKTVMFMKMRMSERDHPRIRGKDRSFQTAFALRQGSPPHTRERPGCSGSRHVQQRITPAYAGKTWLQR